MNADIFNGSIRERGFERQPWDTSLPK
jgi:hypothetical protein